MPYGIALDYVRLALAHVLTASCERANKLVYSGFSGLPTGLREDDAASEDGLAITVYGANAAAAEARLLAHPTTLELSTSSTAEGIEDRVIPTTLAARRLEEMSGLATYIAAVELVCAAQAVDLRKRAGDLGERHRAACTRCVREHVPFCGSGDAPTGDLGRARTSACRRAAERRGAARRRPAAPARRAPDTPRADPRVVGLHRHVRRPAAADVADPHPRGRASATWARAACTCTTTCTGS